MSPAHQVPCTMLPTHAWPGDQLLPATALWVCLAVHQCVAPPTQLLCRVTHTNTSPSLHTHRRPSTCAVYTVHLSTTHQSHTMPTVD